MFAMLHFGHLVAGTNLNLQTTQKTKREWINLQQEDEVDWMLQELRRMQDSPSATPHASHPPNHLSNAAKSNGPPMISVLEKLKAEVTQLRQNALQTLEGEVGPFLRRNSSGPTTSQRSLMPSTKRRKLSDSVELAPEGAVLDAEEKRPRWTANPPPFPPPPPPDQQPQLKPQQRQKTVIVPSSSTAAIELDQSEVLLDESSVLGCGAYASVCYGTLSKSNTPVAVKRFRPHVPDDEFEKELRTVSQLKHPHVVACLGFCRHADDRWILLEWAERGSLFDVLHPVDRYTLSARGPLSWRRKIRMAHDIASAMAYIHLSKYRHCDLNSKNLLVTRDFRIKVADLGLSHQVAEDGSSQLMDRRIGTLRWMAPEMLAKSCRSMEKADVYSFGVVLFELGSEQIPYHDKLDDDVRRLILKNVTPVSGGDSYLWRNQPGFRDLMNACLHQDPSKRPDFPTIAATLSGLLDDLEESKD